MRKIILLIVLIVLVAGAVASLLDLGKVPISSAKEAARTSTPEERWQYLDSPLLHEERSEFGVFRIERGMRVGKRDGSILVRDPTLQRLLFQGTLHDLQYQTSDADVVQHVAPAVMAVEPLSALCWYMLTRQANAMTGRLDPMTYYHRAGPLGDLVHAMSRQSAPLGDIAVLGLGIGSLAAYCQPGQTITFLEIDPVMEQIARERFSYLRDSMADVRIVIGPPRPKLAELPDKKFQLIVVTPVGDEFTPVNLMTREAVQLYLSKLRDDGVVAILTSNRFLDQPPVLGNIAQDLKVSALVCFDERQPVVGKNMSEWVILAKDRAAFGNLLDKPDWFPLRADPRFPLWTDQSADVNAVRRKR